METKILIVEDEIETAEFLKQGLALEGFKTFVVHNAANALNQMKREKYNLVILDLGLPDLDGTELCKTLRADPFLRNIPVIILTARDQPEDKIIGFEVGADDYVTKPFSFKELVLRIHALLKRIRVYAEIPDEVITKGGVTLDVPRHKVTIDVPVEIDLAPKEFELLYLLMKNAGKLLSREFLLETLWGYSPETQSRTLDVHIQRIRKKLGSEKGKKIITVEGYGYKFEE